jgi:hypothetical protein
MASFGGFLRRGAIAGAAGGATTALFIGLVTEAPIEAALRFEEAMGLAAPAGEDELVSRGAQVVGGMVAAVILGVLLGLIVGVVTAAFHHRLTGRNEFERVTKVALGGFVAVTLIPALKYPANPPAVGNGDTIGDRSAQYMLLILAGVVVVYAAWRLWGWLTERGWDGGSRFLAGGGAFVAMVLVLLLAWPATPDPVEPPDNEGPPALVIREGAPTEVLEEVLATARSTGDDWLRDPDDPAALPTSKLVDTSFTTVVWRFRLQSLAGLALLWAVLAGVFGLLADRSARRQ